MSPASGFAFRRYDASLRTCSSDVPFVTARWLAR